MTVSDECLANSVCSFIFDRTGNAWLANASYYALITPGRIIAIVIVAILLRLAVRRVIRRIVRRAGDSRNGQRGRQRGEANAGRERRQQRAEGLGAVLRSLATATIFAVAGLAIIGELGVDLAPLIAGAGFLGFALGIGAQHVVKDFIAGVFMLLEDQYGVGDVVDVGIVSGVVEAVSLRVTTIRDAKGVLWYVRNGEIVAVGNRKYGWTAIMIDVPVGFTRVDDALEKLRDAANAVANDPEFADGMIEPPDVGVDTITADGAVVRITAKTTTGAQSRIGRELRRRLAETLDEAGITASIAANRVFVRQPQPPKTS